MKKSLKVPKYRSLIEDYFNSIYIAEMVDERADSLAERLGLTGYTKTLLTIFLNHPKDIHYTWKLVSRHYQPRPAVWSDSSWKRDLRKNLKFLIDTGFIKRVKTGEYKLASKITLELYERTKNLTTDHLVGKDLKVFVGCPIKKHGQEYYIAMAETESCNSLGLSQYGSCTSCSVSLVSWAKDAECPFCHKSIYLT